ncbi:TOBE domain-containing protein [Photobacterium leiognathi]|uniref:TOBE domain-containing protein n=1 Tax=Photobacterium leiognathi TaxID=553611 RepID=UPI0029827602|nr:TOBE domain-containing protein [Photobacterium leiognathi]
MNLSARNQLKGVVTNIDVGAVNVEVTVEVSPNVELTSILTKKSCEYLGLAVGKEAVLVIKASNVMVATE